MLSKSTIRQQNLRLECFQLVGRYRDSDLEIRVDVRCQDPNCGWVNADGTLRCNDVSLLDFDHLEGDTKNRRGNRDSGLGLLCRIRKAPSRFRILCANCNRRKRNLNGEAQGYWQQKEHL